MDPEPRKVPPSPRLYLFPVSSPPRWRPRALCRRLGPEPGLRCTGVFRSRPPEHSPHRGEPCAEGGWTRGHPYTGTRDPRLRKPLSQRVFTTTYRSAPSSIRSQPAGFRREGQSARFGRAPGSGGRGRRAGPLGQGPLGQVKAWFQHQRFQRVPDGLFIIPIKSYLS